MGLIDWLRRLFGGGQENSASPDVRPHRMPAVRRARDEPTIIVDRSPISVADNDVVERTEAVSVIPDNDQVSTSDAEASHAGQIDPPASDPDATLFLEVPEAADSDATLVLEMPSRVVARLVVVKGELEGEQYELREGENRLGRAPDSDVLLPSMWISRLHATVNCVGGRIELIPVSDKITSVDGQPASGAVELTNGASVQLGGSVFRLEVES